ncbi:LINE-1 reverse transcriptase homolog [Elysia marginata]|uniref:LINE-1 reverse transcriptase homolog n=1 Tax=Elysia marginata TaxID=1093978 RepID=A0AAV4IA51_9GAST|nr:LINE-1 reverse transcriptase homolog [Elysia marginata]
MTLREIADELQHENDKGADSIILALDYKKTFDTVSVKLILETCKHFGFEENFRRWVSTLFKERTAFVKNGGYLSREFQINRGVRQGCPTALLIFLLAAEVLAQSIRQNNRIHGIKLPMSDKSVKIKQFADGTTLFLRDIIDFREALSKMKQFSLFSGLQLNQNKYQALVMGQNRTFGNEISGIKCVDIAKILGVYFSTKKPPQEVEENWTKKTETQEKTLSRWSRKDPSVVGKIHIVKTFGLSLFTYAMQSMACRNVL